MPAISRQIGTTGQNLPVFVPDATVSTGAGLANIIASTCNLSWYRSDMSAVSSNTLTSGTLGTWNSSTLTQASSSNALGWYQVSIPNGALVSGDYCVLHLYGAPSMAPVPIIVELTKENNQQYTSSQVFSSTQVLAAVTAPVGVSTVTIPVGVSSIATPVTASSVTVPVGVSTLPAVSSITTPVTASSVTAPVGVSTLPAVSSITTPVTASSVTALVGVSTLPAVSSITTPLSVSSASATVYEAAADALLNRNVSSGVNTGRLVKEALYVLRNKVDANLGIVYETDDTASSWAFTVSTVAGNPIQVIDPD